MSASAGARTDGTSGNSGGSATAGGNSGSTSGPHTAAGASINAGASGNVNNPAAGTSALLDGTGAPLAFGNYSTVLGSDSTSIAPGSASGGANAGNVNMVVCAACNTQMPEVKAITTLGKSYHTNCLKCTRCSIELASLADGFVAHKGQPYCPPCEEKEAQAELEAKARAAGNVCAECEKPITSGRLAKLSGKVFHPGCIKCEQCRTTITGAIFEADGKRLCEPCNTAVLQQKENSDASKKMMCGGCSQRITSGQVLRVLGSVYHPDCFKCQADGCNTVLSDTIAQFNGKCYCAPCLDKARAQFSQEAQQADVAARLGGSGKCGGCATALEGRIVKALDQHWHEHCFVCQGCSSTFQGGGSFAEVGGKPFHPECAARFRASGAAAAPLEQKT